MYGRHQHLPRLMRVLPRVNLHAVKFHILGRVNVPDGNAPVKRYTCD